MQLSPALATVLTVARPGATHRHAPGGCCSSAHCSSSQCSSSRCSEIDEEEIDEEEGEQEEGEPEPEQPGPSAALVNPKGLPLWEAVQGKRTGWKGEKDKHYWHPGHRCEVVGVWNGKAVVCCRACSKCGKSTEAFVQEFCGKKAGGCK